MALFILFLWFSFCFLGSSAEFLDRKSFPPGFVFGTAGAAYQYEGGVKEGGRGPSVWDTFSHIPGKIADGSTGDVACDSYHRYKEDVKLIQDLGMDAYRFSISWSRILPQGTLEGGVSKEGVKYYHDLIDENLRRGIKPFVTLFHFDMPQALEDKYKGFLSRQIIKDFADYAELCFKEYGDKVKHWITLNEPQSVANFGYDSGKAPPGRCSKYAGNCSHGNSATEPYIVGHNSLLAHAAAVAVYRAKYQTTQKGQIGITLNGLWAKPFANTAKDMKAVKRAIDFFYGWYMSPITKGDYPGTMRRIVGSRLPRFTKEEVKQVNGSYDFIGVNYYSSSYAAHIPHKVRPARYTTDSQANLTGFNKNGVEIGPRAASTWLYIYPPGMREFLLYTKHHYNNPPIYITENGVDEVSNKTWTLQEALNDTARINYYSEHLKQVRKAISGGANVHGFFAWSLLDNFEWTMGYSVRFGLHYVDFINGTLNRYPKASVQWFKDFLRS